VRDLSLVSTECDDSHLNVKSPRPTAEQTNVTLPSTFAVILFGTIVMIGGDTIRMRILVYLRIYIVVQVEENLSNSSIVCCATVAIPTYMATLHRFTNIRVT